MHIPDKRKEEIAQYYFQPFVRIFKEENKKKILDIGCGQGFFIQMLLDAGISASGIELDEDLCKDSVSRGLNVKQTDIFEYLKTTHDVFDGCFASHIVEHFSPEQVSEMFILIRKILVDGGLLIVVTPNIANLKKAAGDFWRDPSHVRPYPAQALEKIFNKTGWQVLRLEGHTQRSESMMRTIVYRIRNVLFGHFWVSDDVYVVAKKK